MAAGCPIANSGLRPAKPLPGRVSREEAEAGPSGVRARKSGCYGVQIDGTTFSRVVVFVVELI